MFTHQLCSARSSQLFSPSENTVAEPGLFALPLRQSQSCSCVTQGKYYPMTKPKVCAYRPFQTYSTVSTPYTPLHGMINTSLVTIVKLNYSTFLGIAVLFNDALLYLPGGV